MANYNIMSQITLSESDDERLYFLCKRAMDILLASILLVILLPLLALIALAIILDSPGPILTTQERIGARRRIVDGRTVWDVHTFRVFKFRILSLTGSSRAPDDPRCLLAASPQITRVGRILCQTYLDELPQLLNVLNGTMSLVGPRPVPTYEAAEYQDWHRERLKALPGIVGLWQVTQPVRGSFDEQMQTDILYVRSRSLWLDIKILLLTIPTLLIGRNHN